MRQSYVNDDINDNVKNKRLMLLMWRKRIKLLAQNEKTRSSKDERSTGSNNHSS